MLGFLGGILVILGVLAGVLFGGIADLITSNGASFFHLLGSGLIDFVLGILMLVFTAYSRAHPPPDQAAGGVVLLIVSAIAWFFAGWSFVLVLVVLGAIFGVLAGILFLLEAAFRGPPRYPGPG